MAEKSDQKLVNEEKNSSGGGVESPRPTLETRPHRFKPMHGQDVCWHCDGSEYDPIHNRRPNFWTEQEASGDIELPRCIHGEPRNVFCGKCEV